MDFDRSRLRKTVFGTYRAAEVDSLLDAAEALLRQKDEERARAIEERTRAVEEQIRADEERARAVEEQARALEDGRAGIEAAERLAVQMRKQKEEGERFAEENRRLAENNQRLNAECRERMETESRMREEMDNLRRELEDMRTQLDLANSQASILGDRVARQRRELDKKDELLLADPVGEATRQAEQIISNATDMSKQMLDSAEGMRSRAHAAVRAAYFNTMGFRQELDERFAALQNDLNQSIRLLRVIEAEEDNKTLQEKW